MLRARPSQWLISTQAAAAEACDFFAVTVNSAAEADALLAEVRN